MPLFGAIAFAPHNENEPHNSLNRYRLMNRGQIISDFCTGTSTVCRCDSACLPNHISILTPGNWSRMVVTSLDTQMLDLVAYIDGGSHGNPGPSGIGVVIVGSSEGTIRIAKWIGRQDNNVAEYAALLEALQCALALRAETLHVFSDSEVVVKQMTGEYSCRSPRLYSLNWICRKLARSLDFSISHLRRENNTEANNLANLAVRKAACCHDTLV